MAGLGMKIISLSNFLFAPAKRAPDQNGENRRDVGIGHQIDLMVEHVRQDTMPAEEPIERRDPARFNIARPTQHDGGA